MSPTTDRQSAIYPNNTDGDSWGQLSRRPTEHPTAEQVHMDVIDGLPGAGIHVEHRAVALLMNVGLRRKFLCDLKHLTNKCVVFRR